MGEVDPERYLCILTYDTIICIDLARTAEKGCRSYNRGPLPTAVVPHVIDISKEGLPVGMAPLSLSSGTKFLIGGEIIGSGKRMGHSTELSRVAYKVIPSLKSSTNSSRDLSSFHLEKDEVSLPMMASGKGCPRVEDVGGKIYVFHTESMWNRSLPLPDHYVEVFDQFGNAWTALPDPPFITPYRLSLGRRNFRNPSPIFFGEIHGVTSLGEHLLVFGGNAQLACFNTENRKWVEIGREFASFNECLTGDFVCSQEPFYRDNDISGQQFYVAVYYEPPEPWAYLVTSDGIIVACQPLPGVFSNIVSSNYNNLSTNRSLIRLPATSNRKFRMCAIYYGPEYRWRPWGGRTILAVCVFSLQKVPGFRYNCNDLYDGNGNRKRTVEPEDMEFVQMEVEKKISCIVESESSNDKWISAFFL